MHYFGAAVVPADATRDNVQEYVEKAVAPHEEVYDEASDELSGVWDWWQVGGRWTAVWGEYDPAKDPLNIETCITCGGSGMRPDAQRFERDTPGWIEWSGGCNGCRGNGTRAKWPSQWRPYEGDVITVNALLNNPPLRRPHTVFLPDGSLIARSSRESGWKDAPDDEWQAVVADALEPYRGLRLAVVDYHC